MLTNTLSPYPMTTPTFEVVTMTPQWASQLLGQSAQKNRKFKRKHLERLTHTIQSGNWYITAQGIALDSEDNILDGQHRLAAVVKAEKPIQIMLGRNLDPKIFNVVDTGATRTAGDVLDILGSSKGKTIAAALKNYQLYYQHPKIKWSGNHTPSHTEVTKLYELHKDYVEAMVGEIAQRRKSFRCFSESVALTFSLLARDKHWSKVPILSFMDAVCFGANLDSEDVCLSFRNQLGSGYLKRRGTHVAQYLLNAFIKCFNSHVQKIPTIKFIAPYPNTEMYAIVDAKKIHPIIEVIPNVPTF